MSLRSLKVSVNTKQKCVLSPTDCQSLLNIIKELEVNAGIKGFIAGAECVDSLSYQGIATGLYKAEVPKYADSIRTGKRYEGP